MQRIAVPVPVPYFGKVWVPLPTPVLAPVPDPDLFRTVFLQQNICTKSCLFNARAALFPRRLASL
jgi:hypothetical protein